MAANNAKLPPEIDQLTQKLVADPKSRVFAQLADAYRKIAPSPTTSWAGATWKRRCTRWPSRSSS